MSNVLPLRLPMLRPKPRIKIATLFILIGCIAILLARWKIRAAGQANFREGVLAVGGNVAYGWQLAPNGDLDPNADLPYASFSSLLGPDYIYALHFAQIGSGISEIENADFLHDGWCIRELSIFDWPSYEHLNPTYFANLKKIEIAGTHVDMRCLRGFSKLEEVTVYADYVLNLQTLAELDSLETITLNSDNIEDPELLKTLTRISNLGLCTRTLIEQPLIDRALYSELKATLPECSIYAEWID